MLRAIFSVAQNLFAPDPRIKLPLIHEKIEGIKAVCVGMRLSNDQNGGPDDYHFVVDVQSDGSNPAYSAMDKPVQFMLSKNCQGAAIQEDVMPNDKCDKPMFPYEPMPECRQATFVVVAENGNRVMQPIAKNELDQKAVAEWKQGYSFTHRGHAPWIGNSGRIMVV